MYNGEFNQCLELTISCETHKECLDTTNSFKSLCHAWSFSVKFTEYKSVRKGDVLSRTLMIYQTAYAGDIVIFKECVRRISEHFKIFHKSVSFIDRGAEPINKLRENV